MRDFYLCYPAILTNTLVPQAGLSSILQNQLGVALDALTCAMEQKLKLKKGGTYREHSSPNYAYSTIKKASTCLIGVLNSIKEILVLVCTY